MAGKEQDSDFDKVGDAFIIESPKTNGRSEQVGGGRPPSPPPRAPSGQKQCKSTVVDGESLKLETSGNRREGQLSCVDLMFLCRGKKISKRKIERLKKLWNLKEPDEDEADIYDSITGKHSKFRMKERHGGLFYSPFEEKNRDTAGVEGNLEIAHVSSYENEKKTRDDDNRVDAKTGVEPEHAESNKHQPEVEDTHKVWWKDSATAPKDEAKTSEGSSN